MLDEKLKLFLKSLSISSDELEAAAKSPTVVEIKLPDAKTMVEASKTLGLTANDFGWVSSEDLEIAKASVKKGVEESQQEIIAKVLMDEFGVTGDKKDLKGIIKAISAKDSLAAVEAAKIPIDDQIKEKDKTISELRTNFTQLESERNTFKTKAEQSEGELTKTRENSEWSRFLPTDYNTLLRPEDYRQRILEEHGIGFKKVDGSWIATNPDGSPMKNKLVQNISAKEKIDEVFGKIPEWRKVAPQAPPDGAAGGGLGTGNSSSAGGGGVKKYSNVTELKAAKVSEKWDNKRYQAEYSKAAIEKDFDPYA